MYPEEIEQKLRKRAGEGLFLLRELLPSMAPVSQYNGWTPEELRTLGYILTATARASESVALLVAYAQLWDAEILSRSVTEGTLKFCYLLQDRTTFKERHREYSEDLFQIALFKDHKKASELLSSLPNPEAPEWKPVRDQLLEDDELVKLGRAYPAAQRRALEGRWGFTGLVSHLAGSHDPLFEGFKGFTHGYSNASHIHHVDYIGAALPMDRERRSSIRRDLALLTHSHRLISEVISLLQLRLQIGYRFIGHDPSSLFEVTQKVANFSATGASEYEEWIGVEYPETFDEDIGSG